MWLMRVMRIGRCICMANPYSWLCQVHCGHGHSHGQETHISQVFLSFWRLSVGYSKSVFVFVLAFVFLLVLLFLIIKGLKLIRLLFVYQLSKHRQWLTEWVTQWQGNIYWAKNAKYEVMLMKLLPVTCENLDSQEFSRTFFKFHFSISISSHFYFTFTSRSRFPVIPISQKEWKGKFFHPFSRNKEWKLTQYFIKKSTIWGGCRTQNKVCPEWFLNSQKFSRNFTSRSRSFFISLSLLDLDFSHFHFTFITWSPSQVIFFHLHFSKKVNGIFS